MSRADKTIGAYERVVRGLGCTLLPKVSTKHGDILLSERKFIHNGVPYYEVFWMVKRDGIDLGRSVRIRAFVDKIGSIQLPVPRLVTQQERINEAVEDAIGFINLCVKHHRYG